ncbi:anti-sigma factor family protein [Devosia sp.]|uniref:anti-sigma factor family protein n=1 Tax=Devosia sp. TaxID=1871048 RepID=UPI003BAC5FAE
MNSKLSPILEADLHAFADGQLDAARQAEVEAWLLNHPEKAAEVANWQRQNEALSALFVTTGNEPIPDRLRPRQVARRSSSRNWGLSQLAAAAIVLIAVGGALGWAGRDIISPPETPKDVLIGSAVVAHALYVKENRHAVEVAGSDRDHLVTWLSNRIDRPFTPPDLAADGFTLVGGRLLPGDYDEENPSPAAQLMYENAAAERVTVYITASLPDEKPAYEFATRDALDAFYWANDKITCTVVGDLPMDQMKAVAKKVYQQLTWRPDADPTRGT